jgi:predicted phage-related endonuclease
MPDPDRKTLSATESPALFGASPYLTKWMLYRKFACGDDIETAANERMNWGKLMQPLIIEQVAQERGLEVIPNDDTYVRRGLLGCTRDATIIAPGIGPGALEIKCVFDYRVWMTKWNGGKTVPREVEIQLQQQMFVGDGESSDKENIYLAYSWGLIAVWVCADLYLFERKPVYELWDDLQRRAIGFFSDVKSKREPDPFGASVELPLLAKLFPTEPKKVLDLSANPDHVKTSEKVSMYVHLKSEATGAAANAEKHRVELLALAKDAERVLLPCGVSYRVKKSGRGKTIDPYIPETPTAAPVGANIMAGG